MEKQVKANINFCWFELAGAVVGRLLYTALNSISYVISIQRRLVVILAYRGVILALPDRHVIDYVIKIFPDLALHYCADRNACVYVCVCVCVCLTFCRRKLCMCVRACARGRVCVCVCVCLCLTCTTGFLYQSIVVD